MARQGEDALRELAHQLRNEIWSLELRSDLTAEGAARRRVELKEVLAGIQGLLAEIARRRARSA